MMSFSKPSPRYENRRSDEELHVLQAGADRRKGSNKGMRIILVRCFITVEAKYVQLWPDADMDYASFNPNTSQPKRGADKSCIMQLQCIVVIYWHVGSAVLDVYPIAFHFKCIYRRVGLYRVRV